MNTPAMRSVRRASPVDVATLARFRYLFRSRHHSAIEAENDFLPRCIEWMSARLGADSHWIAWILEDGGTPIGNLWVQMIEKIPNPGNEAEMHAYVSNVFVLPEYRNSGGGALLLDAAIAECRRANVDSMFLWASDESRPLYKRHGFAEPERVYVNELQE